LKAKADNFFRKKRWDRNIHGSNSRKSLYKRIQIIKCWVFLMEKLRNKKRVLIFSVLSIVLPMSLLATFRLTGILQQPVTISETTTLEAVKWDFKRPDQSVKIGDRLEVLYTNAGLSANIYVLMEHYHESGAPDDNDYLRMVTAINLIATNQSFFIESVHVGFSKDSQSSLVDWLRTYFSFENLSLLGVSDGWTFEERYKEAYVELAGVNHANSIYFGATAEWSLPTPNTQSHQMEVAYEITYYNGTAYNKVVQLFQLKIVGGEGQ
jgi:hypothetical protein